MNKEKQRIAIAEACGIVKQPNSHSSGVRAFTGEFVVIPDYLNDLNAMHEAENILTHQESKLFEEKLFSLRESEVMHRGNFALVHATAAQRAEAFLRTIGKWEDK